MGQPQETESNNKLGTLITRKEEVGAQNAGSGSDAGKRRTAHSSTRRMRSDTLKTTKVTDLDQLGRIDGNNKETITTSNNQDDQYNQGGTK